MQFDFIAKYYAFTSTLVFGRSLEIAKASLFTRIPSTAKVLFIGGGTGTSLKKLVSLKPQAHIDFVETSEQMILRAAQKVSSESLVNFFHSSIEEFEGGGYDVIITEFFFDLFEKEKIETLVSIIAPKLSSKGCWIDTDFRKPDKVFHKILLGTMYLFFKLTSKIEVNGLVETKLIMSENGFRVLNEEKSNSGFISSQLLVRP